MVSNSATARTVHGILQARILEWVAISYSRGSSRPKDQTCISLSLLHWQDSLCHLGGPIMLFSMRILLQQQRITSDYCPVVSFSTRPLRSEITADLCWVSCASLTGMSSRQKAVCPFSWRYVYTCLGKIRSVLEAWHCDCYLALTIAQEEGPRRAPLAMHTVKGKKQGLYSDLISSS